MVLRSRHRHPPSAPILVAQGSNTQQLQLISNFFPLLIAFPSGHHVNGIPQSHVRLDKGVAFANFDDHLAVEQGTQTCFARIVQLFYSNLVQAPLGEEFLPCVAPQPLGTIPLQA